MPDDTELDQRLHRMARTSLDRRATTLDVDAELSALQDSLAERPPATGPSSGRSTNTRWLVAAAAVVLGVGTIGAIAWWQSGGSDEIGNLWIRPTPDDSTSTATERTPDRAPTDLLPQPDQVRWLAPSASPTGLRLIDARRELVAGCGPLADCELTVPSAELVYDTDDLAVDRSARISQTLPRSGDFQASPLDGTPRRVGHRDIVARNTPGSTTMEVAWTETDGIVVTISSVGLTIEQLDALVVSLRPVDPAQWPASQVFDRLGRCVDEHTRYAPTVVPEGWVRYVLDAQPTGTCDVELFLFMSFVEPSPTDQPGNMVTFSVTPASSSWNELGDQITVGDHPATLHVIGSPDGRTESTITMRIDAATIGAHGNVDPETLEQIMSTVALLDEAAWSELVEAVAAEQ